MLDIFTTTQLPWSSWWSDLRLSFHRLWYCTLTGKEQFYHFVFPVTDCSPWSYKHVRSDDTHDLFPPMWLPAPPSRFSPSSQFPTHLVLPARGGRRTASWVTRNLMETVSLKEDEVPISPFISLLWQHGRPWSLLRSLSPLSLTSERNKYILEQQWGLEGSYGK